MVKITSDMCNRSKNGKHCSKPFKHTGEHSYTIRTASRKSKKYTKEAASKNDTVGISIKGNPAKRRNYKTFGSWW